MLDTRGTGVPRIVHWGADLGNLAVEQLTALADASIPAVANSAVSVPLQLTVLPTLDQAWQGRPALDLVPPAGGFQLANSELDGPCVRLTLGASACTVVLEYELTVEGLLRSRATVTNSSPDPLAVGELNLLLPLPDRAIELLDFTGRWGAERRPQRRRIADGTWLRESRHGRGGHDASFVSIAGTDGFGFRSGEVWATTLGWSGNQRTWTERLSGAKTVVGAGELLAPGEVQLARDEHYSTPWSYASWSDQGMDGMSARFHEYLRRTTRSSERARPLLLNTWEAVYFDQDDSTLRELADLAAAVGVERFVLDDGWMAGRVDDTRGLGDWIVDRERRPEGLHPLVDYVTSLGMDFGLWVEPEMATPDSATLRDHPDWLLTDGTGALPLPSRNEYVLNLGIPEAFDHVLSQLDALLADYPIAYLKWDHNRDLLTPAAHDQTLALYRLMDELQQRHPSVEIENCASGGGRVDLGLLERTVRVWPSDNNDALERQSIYRWTGLILPPDMFGAHLGATKNHLTGRTHDLSYRLATNLFGWAGIEWDLRAATEAERAQIANWAARYKQFRSLISTGTVVRADRPDSLWVHGLVAPDGSEALFSVSSLALDSDSIPAPIRLPGLKADRNYTIEQFDFGSAPVFLAAALPAWMSAGGITVAGRALGEVGIAAPPLAPEQAVLLHVRATGTGSR